DSGNRRIDQVSTCINNSPGILKHLSGADHNPNPERCSENHPHSAFDGQRDPFTDETVPTNPDSSYNYHGGQERAPNSITDVGDDILSALVEAVEHAVRS